MSRNLKRCWIARFVSIGLISSLVGWQSVGFAATKVRFEPPKGGAPAETRGGAARRVKLRVIKPRYNRVKVVRPL